MTTPLTDAATLIRHHAYDHDEKVVPASLAVMLETEWNAALAREHKLVEALKRAHKFFAGGFESVLRDGEDMHDPLWDRMKLELGNMSAALSPQPTPIPRNKMTFPCWVFLKSGHGTGRWLHVWQPGQVSSDCTHFLPDSDTPPTKHP